MTHCSCVVEDRRSVIRYRTISFPLVPFPLRLLGGLCFGAWRLLAQPHFALAQGRLDARYEATLAGIPVGKGAWTVDIGDEAFSAQVSGGRLWRLWCVAA